MAKTRHESRDSRVECSATKTISTSVPFPVSPTGPVGGLGKETEVLTVLVAEHSTRLSRLLLKLARRTFGRAFGLCRSFLLSLSPSGAILCGYINKTAGKIIKKKHSQTLLHGLERVRVQLEAERPIVAKRRVT